LVRPVASPSVAPSYRWRKEAGGGEVLDARTDGAQGFDQRADRPLAEPGNPVEAPFSGQRGERGGEKARHGAGVAAVEPRRTRCDSGDQADRLAVAVDAPPEVGGGGKEGAGVL